MTLLKDLFHSAICGLLLFAVLVVLQKVAGVNIDPSIYSADAVTAFFVALAARYASQGPQRAAGSLGADLFFIGFTTAILYILLATFHLVFGEYPAYGTHYPMAEDAATGAVFGWFVGLRQKRRHSNKADNNE